MVTCPRRQQDALVWAGTKNGIFSIRSAYHLAKTLKDMEQGSSSTGVQTGEIWRNILKIGGPRVVQIFLWIACQNSLPTKGNLFRRHLTSDDLCPIFGRDEETPVHILWNCLSARDVWHESLRKLQKCSSEAGDFADLFARLSGILNQEELNYFVTVARQIWFRRNSVIHGGELISPSMVIRKAREQIEGYKKAFFSSGLEAKPDTCMTTAERLKRKAPPDDFIKINWDASIDVGSQRMRMGMVARNNRGEAVAMCCATKPFVNDPSAVEAMAVAQAVQLGRRMAWEKIIPEGDALEVVQLLRRREPWLGSFGTVIEDTRRELE